MAHLFFKVSLHFIKKQIKNQAFFNLLFQKLEKKVKNERIFHISTVINEKQKEKSCSIYTLSFLVLYISKKFIDPSVVCFPALAYNLLGANTQ